MTARGRLTAFMSGLAVIAFALAILLLARSQGGLEPPQAESRGLASVALLAAPGLIGLIGAWARRPTVVVAAGVICLLQSVVAFSGVTLVYLLPAIGFLRAATDDGGSSSRARPAFLIVGAILAVPIAVAVVLSTGVLGVLLLVLAGGLAASRRGSRHERRLTAGALARGLAIVILVVGAWLATFAATETACWAGRTEPGGAVAWERIPATDTLVLDEGITVSTCAAGIPTPAALLVSSVLVAAAIGVAALPPGLRPMDRASGPVGS
jgi:hypothetical protein